MAVKYTLSKIEYPDVYTGISSIVLPYPFIITNADYQ
jgi:hypothetical protein